MTSLASSLPSDSVTRYRPLLPLGHGGMADVVLAVCTGPTLLGKLVVLKAMRKELVPDFELRRLFLAEARLTARMDHPNVVQVHEVIETTQPRIVIEYLDGQSFAAIQQRAPESFTVAMQLQVLVAVLNGLHYTHELCDDDGSSLGIVHRDVSPQNVFVTYDGRVKVLDFGIATRTAAGDRTHSGVIKGKFAYMPREQLLGEPVDRRADIHAVGAMLWHAAAGVRLWDGMEPAEAMRCLVEGRIPLPSSVRPVDSRLERMTMKALAPERRDRYATAAELREDIEHYLSASDAVCSLREVGEFVLKQFASERSERSRLIRIKLRDRGLEQAPRVEVAESGDTGGGPALAPVEQVPARRWSPRLAAAGAVLLLAAGGGVYGFGSGTESRPQLGADASAKPVVSEWVRVRISVYPANATLTVDGETMQESPVVLMPLIDARQHEVVAQLDGYKTIVRQLRFDRDLSLDLVLEPLVPQSASVASVAPPRPEAEPPSRESQRRAVPRSRVGAKSSPTSPSQDAIDCSPPFYYQRGIKTFKPGCI